MTEPTTEAVAWGLAAALAAVAVLLVRLHGITRRLRHRNAELADALRAREDELRHLVRIRLPAVADTPRRAGRDPGPVDARFSGTDFGRALERILFRFTGAVEHAQARADQSAKAALKASMRSIQALANEQQVSIAEMQERHDHPDVLRDLLEIDHTNAQFGRRAQAIAVLCGSWPGRQRSTSPLIDVVRGATSRIRDYRRVRVNGRADVAVQSRAVEPVVLAVAELLDNAARHSQPNTHVEVNVQTVHNGACVIIDDAGVGMDGRTTAHASELLTGQRPVDVTRLDDPPRFGHAVTGVLARRYGFDVSVDTRSPYGGVRAVVFLPSALLTQPSPEPVPSPPVPRRARPAPEHGRPPARSAGPARPEETDVPANSPRTTDRAEPAEAAGPADGRGDRSATDGTTEGGLPRRRRRTRQEPPPGPAAPAPAAGPPARSPEENARRMGAFARGTRHGREDSGPAATDGPPAPRRPADTPTTDDEGTTRT